MNIPALLDLFRIPYTGSSPLTLGLCQDKGKVKDILQSQGILTPRYKIFERMGGSMKGNIFPIIVKPLHEDGSLGISGGSVCAMIDALLFLVLLAFIGKLLEDLKREGFTRVRVDGQIRTLDEDINLDKKYRHDIDAGARGVSVATAGDSVCRRRRSFG